MFRIRLVHLWIGLPIFVILWKGMRFPLPYLDFWWHLKMGEIVWTTHSIPHTDLFSFTAAGKPFIVQNWLAEVVLYFIYKIGGLELLVFLKALLLAGTFLPVYALCREATSRSRLSAVVGFLVAMMFFCVMRPQLFSFVLFAFYYWVLEGYRLQRRDRLYLLPLLMALWVNLHGAFVLGLGLLALYLGCEAIRRLINPSRQDVLSPRRLAKLGVVLVACLAATLANPEFIRVYDYLRVVMADAASQQYVVEWQPPRVDSINGVVLFYGLFFITALSLIYSKLKPGLTEVILFFGFSIFALTALRNTIWFAIIAGPILTRHLAAHDITECFGRLRRLRLIGTLTNWSTVGGNGTAPHYRLNLALVCIALFGLILVSPWVQSRIFGASLVEAETPVGAMDFIEKHNLKGNIFHPQIFGDYLIWRLWPNQRSFIDGRVHLFGVSFVREYHQVFSDPNWEALLSPYGIRYLLLSNDPNDEGSRRMIARVRSTKYWISIYEDHVAALFEHQGQSLTKGGEADCEEN